MQRRDLIKGIGGTTVAGMLAGCLSDIDAGSSGDGDDGENDGDDGSSGDRQVVGQSIETLSSDSNSGGDGDYEVSSESNVVTITGTISAPTPCHVATLKTVEYDAEADELSVTVGTEDDSGEDEACQQVISDLEYEAEIEFEGGTPADDAVTVTHDGAMNESGGDTNDDY